MKLNHLNLGSPTAIKAIRLFIEINPFINLLDIAFCSLGAKEMLDIITIFNTFPDHIKSLNLSYNQLLLYEDYEEEIVDPETLKSKTKHLNSAEEFFRVMAKYVKKSRLLNHLDLSGLKIMEVIQ